MLSCYTQQTGYKFVHIPSWYILDLSSTFNRFEGPLSDFGNIRWLRIRLSREGEKGTLLTNFPCTSTLFSFILKDLDLPYTLFLQAHWHGEWSPEAVMSHIPSTELYQVPNQSVNTVISCNALKRILTAGEWINGEPFIIMPLLYEVCSWCISCNEV